ncbi:Ig-like domain-containing protein, partial [Desulfovibrio psychrotolerans]|uniref:Ig-like domain-containing protein n=1 Tax=Desulfovibrio psychrotolerans TaxID=415242 RepID=UPI00157A81A5
NAHADVAVAEGDALLRGKLTATDVDGDKLTFTLDADSDVPAGFVLKPNGSYSFNPKHGEYNSLAEGQEATFTIKYTVTDVHG